MLRIINAVDKSVVLVPFVPVVVNDSVSTPVVASFAGQRGEIAGIFIQNVGANDCYYSFSHECDPTNFCGMLSKAPYTNTNGHGSGQQLDASNCGQNISVYSIGGTTISLTIMKRNDNAQGQGNILPPNAA